jgi:hypothetical protein
MKEHKHQRKPIRLFFAIEQHHESKKKYNNNRNIENNRTEYRYRQMSSLSPLDTQIVNASKIKVGRISTATPRFDNNCFLLLNKLSFASLFIWFVIVCIGEWWFNGYIVKFVELLELKSTMQPDLEILIDLPTNC